MAAAYELLKMGLTPVVFEATDRIGGRGYSHPFTDTEGQPSPAIAEMGSMRVPVSNEVFYYYAKQFGFQYSSFPDPGQVPTQLYYLNQVYQWKPGAPPPGPFQRIANDFNTFAASFTKKIWPPWKAGDMQTVRQIWQGWIDQYKNKTFYEALIEGIPQWGPADLNAFGALGMGSGGFGPLYEVGFLEMLRIIVNQWEVEQQLMQWGMNCLTNSNSTVNKLTDSFYTKTVTWPNGQTVSLERLNAVRLNTPVTRIGYSATGNPVLSFNSPANEKYTSQEFRAVIVATTTRSMEISMRLTRAEADNPNLVLPPDVKDSLRNLHLVESSKMFIRTATKFWKAHPELPLNIQTDELPRGIVLISYTWGDDSAKLLALPPSERFQLLKEVIQEINPTFAEYLVPLGGDDQIYNIDWESEPYYYGAFKLDYPGQEPDVHTAYYQFLNVLDAQQDTGVYLAGDSVSWSGGWTEGALHTGLNTVAAVAHRLGGTLADYNPLTQDPKLYSY